MLQTNRASVASRALLLAVALVAQAVLGAVGAGATSDHATTFVQKAASEAIVVLQDKSLPDDQRRAKFRSVVQKSFDSPTIGQLVVGLYWSTSTTDQQSRFQVVFEGALANIYTDRFFDYDGRSLQIIETRANPNGTSSVRTTVSTPTGDKTYDVEWVVAGPAGKEKFLDVVIDGISTSITTQQDYTSVLRAANGNLDALTTALKAKG